MFNILCRNNVAIKCIKLQKYTQNGGMAKLLSEVDDRA